LSLRGGYVFPEPSTNIVDAELTIIIVLQKIKKIKAAFVS